MPRPLPVRPQVRNRALDAVAAGVVLLVVAAYLAGHTGNPLDFHTYYYAAMAHRAGLDPYRLESLRVVAGRPVGLQFLYPPITLWLFVPFTLVPLVTAGWAWLGFKLVLVVALVAIWRRWFLPDTSVALLLAAAFLGFNGALTWDLASGNVAVLEQVLLWLAFACYVDERRTSFAALVSIASVFKLTPVVLLGLLLVPSRRHRRSVGLVVMGLALFLVLVFAPIALGLGTPAQLTLRPVGVINPSALGMLDTLLGPVDWAGGSWTSGSGAWHPVNGKPDLSLILWGIYAVALLALSWPALVATWRSKDPRRALIVTVLALALLSTRMMVYSYIVLVVPAMLLIPEIVASRWARSLALGAIVFQGLILYLGAIVTVPILAGPFGVSVVVMNLSYWLALAIWLGLLWRVRVSAASPPRSVEILRTRSSTPA